LDVTLKPYPTYKDSGVPWLGEMPAYCEVRRIRNDAIHGPIRSVALNQSQGTRGVWVWQCTFYDQIIRDDEALDRIRQYIVDNPSQWAHDPENRPPAGDIQ
jgi:hypothetical protein